MKTFGTLAYNFLRNLDPQFALPENVELLLPFENAVAQKLTKEFFDKYYNDSNERTYVLGINPGRHGAGVTGISFTDPVRLEKDCGIKNDFPKKGELSSEFIYNMINEWGGPDLFYRNFFLSAICPVGFIKNGKNINYYDEPILIQSSRKFIIETLKEQISFGARKNCVICLGEGKNYKYLKSLNDELKIFGEIIPLAHPRYIMQYKRKKVSAYYKEYLKVLTKTIGKN